MSRCEWHPSEQKVGENGQLRKWLAGFPRTCITWNSGNDWKVRATITSHTLVTLSFTDHECPLTSMQYMHSTQNCTSGSRRGHPTMSEVSLTYKLWILGKCACECVCVHVCMHTCTHCHVPVMDFILIGYDIVQGLVGLLGTRVSVFPISLIKGNSFIQPPWSSLCSKWEIQAAVN